MGRYYDVVMPSSGDLDECVLLNFLEPGKELEYVSIGAKIKSIPQVMESAFQYCSIGDALFSINNIVMQDNEFGAIIEKILSSNNTGHNYDNTDLTSDMITITFQKVADDQKIENKYAGVALSDCVNEKNLESLNGPSKTDLNASLVSFHCPPSSSKHNIPSEKLTFGFVNTCQPQQKSEELNRLLLSSHRSQFMQQRISSLKTQKEPSIPQSPYCQEELNQSRTSSIYMTPFNAKKNDFSRSSSLKNMSPRFYDDFQETIDQPELDQTYTSILSAYTCIDDLGSLELKQKVNLLRKDVKLARTCIEELMNQNDEMIDIIHILEGQEKCQPKSGSDLKEDMVHLQNDITCLNETVKIISNQLLQSGNKFSKEQERVKISESNNDQLKAENRRLNFEIGKLRKELGLCKKVISEFKTSSKSTIDLAPEPSSTLTRTKSLKFQRYTSLSPLRKQQRFPILQTFVGQVDDILREKASNSCDEHNMKRIDATKNHRRSSGDIRRYHQEKSKKNQYQTPSKSEVNRFDGLQKENNDVSSTIKLESLSISKDFSSLRKLDKFRNKKNRVLSRYQQNRVKLQSPMA